MRRKDRRRASLAPRLDLLEARTLLNADPRRLVAPAHNDPAQSLLVRFADHTSAARMRATLRTLGGHVLQKVPNGPTVVALDSGVDREAVLARLRRNPRVRYAEPNAPIRAAFIPNDPSFTGQWGLNNANDVDIDAPQAWDVTTGAGTIVAVLDTGFDPTHPDLVSRLWVNPGEVAGNRIDDDRNGHVDDVNGWNFDTDTNNIRDDNGHGSHVAGTIAATGHNGQGGAGVAWNARIMPLKVLDSEGYGATDAVVAAVYYAVAHGARVINASWGGAGYSQALADAIRYAGSRGVVFVTAAGNEAANNGVTRTYPAGYRFSNVLSVAAVDASGALARFSNFGATTVDLAGPGVGILSTVPGGYEAFTGTSMSTPFVAGVVALLATQHPEYSAAQLVQRVLATAKPLSSLARRTVTGGLVDAAGALGVSTGPDNGNGGGPVVASPPTSPPVVAPPPAGPPVEAPPPAGPPVEAPPPGSPPGNATLPASPASDDSVQAVILASPESYAAHGGTVTGFVAGLYDDLLGRAPDEFGLSFWSGQLRAGASHQAVAQGILASPEARQTKVARWYRDDLRRPGSLEQLKADPGVAFWAGALAGASDNAVWAMILASPEYDAVHSGTSSGFVAGLYDDLLGRALDEFGLSFWSGQLRAGVSHQAVAQGILASPEARQTKVARWYRDDLRRPGSLEQLKADSGVAFWAGLLTTT